MGNEDGGGTFCNWSIRDCALSLPKNLSKLPGVPTICEVQEIAHSRYLTQGAVEYTRHRALPLERLLYLEERLLYTPPTHKVACREIGKK